MRSSIVACFLLHSLVAGTTPGEDNKSGPKKKTVSQEEIHRLLHEQRVEPLRNAPKKDYQFSQVALGRLLQFLAQEAGVSFYPMRKDNDLAMKLIDLEMTASPFTVMEELSKKHNFPLLFHERSWQADNEQREFSLPQVRLLNGAPLFPNWQITPEQWDKQDSRKNNTQTIIRRRLREKAKGSGTIH